MLSFLLPAFQGGLLADDQEKYMTFIMNIWDSSTWVSFLFALAILIAFP